MYQIRQPQGKLVRVIAGEVFDVAVDLRRHSPTFGQWTGAILSAENKLQLWVPPGFAHGIYTLSPTVDLLYKVTDHYAPQWERTLLWNDPQINIAWPLVDGQPPTALGSTVTDLAPTTSETTTAMGQGSTAGTTGTTATTTTAAQPPPPSVVPAATVIGTVRIIFRLP